MTKQLTLDMPLTSPSFGEDDFFVSESNYLAHRMVSQWPNWNAQALMIYGPSGSGKTHLAHIWQRKSHALFATPETISQTDGLLLGHSVIENVEAVFSTQDPEEGRRLLRCINFLAQHNYSLLLTAQHAPAFWPISLPDLASRLCALPCMQLREPDDPLLEVVLQRGFFLRQLQVAPEVIAYLLKRIPRSFEAIHIWLNRIDSESLSHSRTITIPFLKSIFNLV